MAFDMFLKLDGISGESKDSKHKDEIEILSFSWGVSNSGTSHVGGGAGSGKASFQDLSLVAMTQKSSIALLESVSSGKHISSGTLTLRKAGSQPLEFLKIKLTDILVSSFSLGGATGGESTPTDAFTLNFSKVDVDYTEQKADGSGTPGGSFGWDVGGNKKI
jgi:type VI secretion system secreted protein Hcp